MEGKQVVTEWQRMENKRGLKYHGFTPRGLRNAWRFKNRVKIRKYLKKYARKYYPTEEQRQKQRQRMNDYERLKRVNPVHALLDAFHDFEWRTSEEIAEFGEVPFVAVWFNLKGFVKLGMLNYDKATKSYRLNKDSPFYCVADGFYQKKLKDLGMEDKGG